MGGSRRRLGSPTGPSWAATWVSHKFSRPLDVAGLARAMGANGIRVQTLEEFRHAFGSALASAGPSVIDAWIDPAEVPPALSRRVQTLSRRYADIHTAETRKEQRSVVAAPESDRSR